jgi:hypothetical protein
MTLALRSYIGPAFNSTWTFIQPFAYMVSIVIWLATMWSYHPNPVPDSGIRLEEDYEALAARTQYMMGAMRAHLVKVPRS